MAEIEVKQRATVRISDICDAIGARAEKGGAVFYAYEVDIEDGVPVVTASLKPEATNEAIAAYLNGGRLVPDGPIVWGVDESGIFAACDVKPKPRKPRAGKGG